MTQLLTLTLQLLSPEILLSTIISWQTFIHSLESNLNIRTLVKFPLGLDAHSLVIHISVAQSLHYNVIYLYTYLLCKRPETPQVSSVSNTEQKPSEHLWDE